MAGLAQAARDGVRRLHAYLSMAEHEMDVIQFME